MGSCSAASAVSAVVFVFVPVLVPVPAVLVPGSLLVSGSSIDMMTDSDSDIESGIESPTYVSTAADAVTTIGRHVRGRLWRKWFDDTVDTVVVRLVHDVLHGVLRGCWPWWSQQERLLALQVRSSISLSLSLWAKALPAVSPTPTHPPPSSQACTGGFVLLA